MGGKATLLKVAAFIYARMTSTRLPGKVFLPVLGNPLLYYSLQSYANLSIEPHILTSTHSSDDPLEDYALKNNYSLIRGDLSDVASRTKKAILVSKADYFFRVNADSPFVNKFLIQWGLDHIKSDINPHVITNVLGKTFPYGLSLELIQSEIFLSSIQFFNSIESEHITSYFYNNQSIFNIVTMNLSCSCRDLRLVVDTSTDYKNVIDNYDKFSRLRECPLNNLENEIKSILNK